MLLAYLGAEVLRIDRPGGNGWPNPVVHRVRATLILVVRTDAGRAAALEAIKLAYVLIEGNRPGVMELLGLGPDVALERNRALSTGRMTGWDRPGRSRRQRGMISITSR